METLIVEAINRGFTHFGITDHVCTYNYEDHSLIPDKYDKYVDKINEYKEKYKDKIEYLLELKVRDMVKRIFNE